MDPTLNREARSFYILPIASMVKIFLIHLRVFLNVPTQHRYSLSASMCNDEAILI
jgi:hypothetical protein